MRIRHVVVAGAVLGMGGLGAFTQSASAQKPIECVRECGPIVSVPTLPPLSPSTTDCRVNDAGVKTCTS